MAGEQGKHGQDPVNAAQVDLVADGGGDGAYTPGAGHPAAAKAAWSWTAKAAVVLAVAGVIVLAVTLPVCLTQGCPRKPTTVAAARKALRLIVALNNEQDALQSLPPELQQFAQNIKLNSSQLQVLTLQSEDILQQVERILKENPDLELLVRDFSLASKRVPATRVKSSQQRLPPWAAAKADTSRQQQPGGQAAGALLHQQQVQELVQKHNVGWLQRYQRRLQQGGGWAGSQRFLDQIRAAEAWNVTTGQPSIVVAVLDTGVDVNHHALRGALWVNPREVPGNGVDDDGNGYVDDVHGFSFQGSCDGEERDYFGGCISCADNGDVTDTVGHGTHVAGIIAAARDDAAGVVGVAPSARVMVLKVADCVDGIIYGSAVFRAMDYAVKMGADVLSCSFSRQYTQGFAAVSPAPPWENHVSETSGFTKALTPLAAANVAVISAAGNNHVDMDRLKSLGYSNNPCLVPLPNVVCVGATDDQDRLADYSNYGLQTVDLSAPGTIRSTWLGDGYADSWGTSMATPVVSASAALVISVIQRLTGNFTSHGAVTKSLLMSSADTPAAAAGGYSRRINMQRAVDAAVRAYTNSAGIPVTTPLRAPWALPGAAPSGIEMTGVTEGYYWTPGTPGTSWQTRPPQDLSARGPALPFGGFKYSSNMTMVLTGNLRLEAAGLYMFRLSPPAAQLFINGAVARPLTSPLLGSATRTLPLLAGGPGVYQLQVVVATPGPPVDLLVLGPSADTYQRVTGLFTYLPPPPADATPGGPNAPTSSTTLLMLWNTTASGTILPRAAQLTAASTTNFQQGAAVNGVALSAPGALSGLLLPPGQSSGSAVGMVAAALAVPSSPLGGWAFRLTCNHCSLSLGGNVILDNWEGAATNSVRTKNSGCMAFAMPVTGQLPALLSFVVPNILSSSQLVLTWAPCSTSGGSTSFGAWSNVPLTTTAAWQPGTPLTGSIGGMQCSLWRTAAVPQPGVAPLYKWRLPGAMSAVNSLTAGANMLFNTTLGALLPGFSAAFPASSTTRFSLRCWTYTTGSRQQQLQLRAVGTPGATTAAFEGEVQVWDGVTSRPPLSRTNWGTSRQQLLLVWQGITTSTQLTVLRGGQVLLISGSAMTLPIAMVPAFTGALMAGPGHFSQAFTPGAAGDVGNLVTYSPVEMTPRGTFNNPTFGLNVAVGSYAGVPAGSVRYARTVGYYRTPVSSLTQVNLTIGEPGWQGCTVVVGGVVLRNGVGFNSRTTASVTSEYALLLPPGFVQMQVIVKSRAAGSGATFSIGAAAPGSGRASVAPPAWWQAQPSVLQD